MATDAKKTFLITLFFISLITHVLFFCYFFYTNPCLLSFDSAHYHEMALALKNHFCFCTPDGAPYFYRLPGYPVFLASIYALFGLNPYYVIGIQILLASLLPVLVFFLSKKLFIHTRSTPPAHPEPVEGLERTGAKLACLITSFHPAFFIFPCLIMSEMLFVFLFTLFLIMFMRGLESHFQPTWPFFSGLLLGIISLIRPLGPQLVIICIFLTVLYPGLSIFCRFFKSFLLFFGWGLVVSLWLLRNFLLTGSLFFHTFSGPHLLNHGATRIIMETQHISYQEAKKVVQKDLEEIEKGLVHDKFMLISKARIDKNNVFLAHAGIQSEPSFLTHDFNDFSRAKLYVLPGSPQASLKLRRAFAARLVRHSSLERRLEGGEDVCWTIARQNSLYLTYFFCRESREKPPEISRSRLQEKYALRVMMHYPSTTIPFFIKNMVKTTISLYASELLFVDSGGKLPPYDTKRSVRDMINRFLFPEVTNKAIPYVIYYELIFMLFLFVGFALFLVTDKNFFQKILMLSFIALFIGMSCVCGFARLRLPIEPMLIIGAAYFYSRTASKFPDS